MEKSLSVKFVQKEQKFIIYKEDNLLGIFTILGIIKYITNGISKKFLETIEYEQNVEFIEKFFCRVNENGEIILSGYLESPIMGNIEVVMKIYTELLKIEDNLIQHEINKIEDNNEKKNIINKIKELFYLILNHSLKLIMNISDAIKNDREKYSLKYSLVKYSVFITNKINDLLYEKMNDCKNEYNLLELEFEQMKKVKNYTEKKINSFEKKISFQELKINKIIDYIEIDDMDDIMNIEDSEQYENSSDNFENNNVFNESDNEYSENIGKSINIDYLTPRENM